MLAVWVPGFPFQLARQRESGLVVLDPAPSIGMDVEPAWGATSWPPATSVGWGGFGKSPWTYGGLSTFMALRSMPPSAFIRSRCRKWAGMPTEVKASVSRHPGWRPRQRIGSESLSLDRRRLSLTLYAGVGRGSRLAKRCPRKGWPSSKMEFASSGGRFDPDFRNHQASDGSRSPGATETLSMRSTKAVRSFENWGAARRIATRLATSVELATLPVTGPSQRIFMHFITTDPGGSTRERSYFDTRLWPRSIISPKSAWLNPFAFLAFKTISAAESHMGMVIAISKVGDLPVDSTLVLP